MSHPQIEVVGDGEFRIHYELSETDLSATLAMVLDEVTSIDAEEALGELAHHVDPDALDRLFQPIHGGPDCQPMAQLNVEIQSSDVTIYSDGTIRISE